MPTINIDAQQDSSVSSVTVLKENYNFSLQIDCRSFDIANDLRGTLGGLKKIYEAEEGKDSQNFVLQKLLNNSQSLKISGNIFNALNILREKEVINKVLFKILDSHQEIQSIISDSKTFILSNVSSLGFFDPESISRKPALSPTESKELEILKNKISHLSDIAKAVLMRDLREKYKNLFADIEASQKMIAK